MDLPTWQAHDARIKAEQVPDGPPLIDRLPRSFLESLTPREALALKYEPRAFLRRRQRPPTDIDWLTWCLLSGRSWGKSYAAGAWVVEQLRTPGDIMLIAPTIDQVWGLQVDTIKQLLPPWLRFVERVARGQLIFPDTGARLLLWSAQNTQLRGFNLKAAWGEELTVWPSGRETWSNLTRALRVKGATPARAVATFTPPRELSWVLDLCVQPTTRVTRGTARDNTATDPRNVEAWYKELEGTIESARELDGEVVLGVDGAPFDIETLERYRVATAPPLERVVVSVDPATRGDKTSDTVGIVAVGIAHGELYILESVSERLPPASWAERAVSMAAKWRAGQFIVENAHGAIPRHVLNTQMSLTPGTMMRPIVDSKATGSKADRCQPLSAAAANGRVHLVGRHEALEREMCTWFPGASFSPGGLDALVHGAQAISNQWRAIR